MRGKRFLKLVERLDPKSTNRLRSMGYTFGQWIGGSDYVSVYSGMLWNAPVAFKLQDFSLVSSTDRNMFIREIAILKTLKHDHLVELYDVLVFQETLVYTMEAAEGGDLCDLIEAYKALSEPQTSRFYKQVGSGLKHLHLNGFAHCDMKPKNILLNAERQLCKICDYSLSQYIYCVYTGTTQGTRGVIGTKRYLAPENFEFGMAHTTKLIDPQKIDIWAMGVTFYQCVNGMIFPFESIRRNSSREEFDNILSKMKNAILQVKWPNQQVSREFKHFINKHWIYDPNERPEIKELLFDPWLNLAHSFSPKPLEIQAQGTNATTDTLPGIKKNRSGTRSTISSPDNDKKKDEPNQNGKDNKDSKIKACLSHHSESDHIRLQKAKDDKDSKNKPQEISDSTRNSDSQQIDKKLVDSPISENKLLPKDDKKSSRANAAESKKVISRTDNKDEQKKALSTTDNKDEPKKVTSKTDNKDEPKKVTSKIDNKDEPKKVTSKIDNKDEPKKVTSKIDNKDEPKKVTSKTDNKPDVAENKPASTIDEKTKKDPEK